MMSHIVASKKSRKKQSAFEKLWARAAKLRTQNEKFRADLDVVVQRMDEILMPREKELASQQIPLLQKLLTLGQRKSMTNWERETLDEWIRELIDISQAFGLVSEDVMDDVARYDAFRMGISLEDDSIPPHKQFGDIMQEVEEERAAAYEKEAEERQKDNEFIREQMILEAQEGIERRLDKLLGPEPAQAEKHAMTQDLWADELDAEQLRQSTEYRQKRAEMREKMLKESIAEIDDIISAEFDVDDDDFDFEDFDFSAFEEAFAGESDYGRDDSPQTSPNAALSSETFQRLFRATAGKLHPDREPDSVIRKEKQKLMANLLKARKKGDVMTVLEMYETYVGEHEGFSKEDQKSLINSLQQMVDELEQQKEEIAFQSPHHATAYHLFYSPSKKKVDAAFADRLKEMNSQEKFNAHLVSKITSLKTLKPELEVRYDSMRLSAPTFEDFMRFVDEEHPF